MKPGELPIKKWPTRKDGFKEMVISHVDNRFIWIFDESDENGEILDGLCSGIQKELEILPEKVELQELYVFQAEDDFFFRGFVEDKPAKEVFLARALDYGIVQTYKKAFKLSDELKNFAPFVKKVTPSLWPDDNSAKAEEVVKVMFHENPDQPESPVVTVEGWTSEKSYYRVPSSKGKSSHDYQIFEMCWADKSGVFLIPRQCKKIKDLIDDQLYYLHETKVPMLESDMDEGVLCNVLEHEDEMDFLVRGKIDERIGDNVVVTFIDRGDEKVIKSEKIFKYDAEFFYNVQALAFRLDMDLSPPEIELFGQEMKGNLFCIVESVVEDRKTPKIKISRIKRKDGKCFYKLLENFRKERKARAEKIEQKQERASSTTGSITSTRSVASSQQSSGLKPQLKWKEPNSNETFYITDIVPGPLGTFLVAQTETALAATEKLTAELGKEELKRPRAPQVGRFYVIKTAEGCSRAQLLKTNENGSVDILYADYGYSENLPVTSVHILPKGKNTRQDCLCAIFEIEEVLDGPLKDIYVADINSGECSWRLNPLKKNPESGRAICSVEVSRKGGAFEPVNLHHSVDVSVESECSSSEEALPVERRSQCSESSQEDLPVENKVETQKDLPVENHGFTSGFDKNPTEVPIELAEQQKAAVSIFYERYSGPENALVVTEVFQENDQTLIIGQISDANVDWVDELTSKLDEIKEPRVLRSPKVGDFCVSPTPEGNSRAQIMRIADGEFTLLWTDFGYCSPVNNCEDLWEIPANLTEQAACSILQFDAKDGDFVSDVVRRFNENPNEEVIISAITVGYDEISGITSVRTIDAERLDACQTNALSIDNNAPSEQPIPSSVSSEVGKSFNSSSADDSGLPKQAIETEPTIDEDGILPEKPAYQPIRSAKFAIPVMESNSKIDIQEFCPPIGFLVARESKGLDELQEQLQCTAPEQEKLDEAPVVGDCILAKWSDDGNWYRAIVMKDCEKSFDVVFADYGNDAQIKKADLIDYCRVITKEQAKEPMFCMWVSSDWKFEGDESTINEFLQEIYDDKTLASRVVEITACVADVKAVLLLEGEEIQSKFPEMFFKSPSDAEDQPSDVEEQPSAVEDDKGSSDTNVEERIQEDEENYERKESSEIMEDNHGPENIQEDSDDSVSSSVARSPEIPLPTENCSVQIIEFDQKKGLLVSREDPSGNADILINSIKEKAESQSKLAGIPKIGDFIIAKWDDDQTWYRACVTDITNENLVVFFTDYGNESVIKIEEYNDFCRALSKEQAQEPMLSFWVHSGWDFEGEESDVSKAIDKMYENESHVPDLKMVRVKAKEGIASVDACILADGVDIVKRLPGLTAIMDDGIKELEIPSEDHILPEGLQPIEETFDAEDDLEGPQNASSSSSDRNSLPSITEELEDSPDFSFPKPSEDDKEELKEGLPESTVSETRPFPFTIPFPPAGSVQIQEFIPGRGFLVYREEPQEKLDNFQKTLQETAPKQEIPATPPTVGDYLIVQWDEDKDWYRAAVVSSEDKCFTVFFVDYGNDAVIENENYEKVCRKITQEQCEEPMIFYFVNPISKFNGDEKEVNKFIDEIYEKEGMPKETDDIKPVGAASVDAEILIDGVEILTKFPGMFVAEDPTFFKAASETEESIEKNENELNSQNNDEESSEEPVSTPIDMELKAEREALEKCAGIMFDTTKRHTKEDWLNWIARGKEEIQPYN